MTRSWHVLVLAGASGTGKSTVASTIAGAHGISWMQVDDLRLALQYARVTLPERTADLYFLETTPNVWGLPPDTLRQALIRVAEVMVPAIRVVIDSHVVTGVPLVLEGDGVLPHLFMDPVIAPHVASGAVRFCCLTAVDPAELLENMLARGRGDHLDDHVRANGHANANWAFNQWLVAASRELGIPVVPSRPFATLAGRIERAISPEAGEAGGQDPRR